MKTYIQRINLIHRELGIPENYECEYGLRLQQEENELIEIENDIYGREQRLVPVAANDWKVMKYQALKEGIVLNVVSAFRAVDRQKEIIQAKMEAGQPIKEILQVCAAPGFSEHHTGRALDLTSTESEPLSEMFEDTEAYNWLMENANHYSFKISYPKGNNAGILYEPWHWAHYHE